MLLDIEKEDRVPEKGTPIPDAEPTTSSFWTQAGFSMDADLEPVAERTVQASRSIAWGMETTAANGEFAYGYLYR
jgi:hypothetical protein